MSEKECFCEFCGAGFIYKDTLNYHTVYACKKAKHDKVYKGVKQKNLSIPCDYCDEVLKGSVI